MPASLVPPQAAQMPWHPPSEAHGPLRLEPIETPKGLVLRLAYWFSRRQFGVVPAGLKVVAPRVPGILRLSMAIQRFDKSLRIDRELRLLVAALVSGINGCGFCLDLKHMLAVQDGLGLEKFNALPEYRTSPLFSARERAALRYGEEVTLQRQPSDATFAELRRHLADWEVAELTSVVALENFFNLGNIPLGIGSEGLCALAQSKR